MTSSLILTLFGHVESIFKIISLISFASQGPASFAYSKTSTWLRGP